MIKAFIATTKKEKRDENNGIAIRVVDVEVSVNAIHLKYIPAN